MQEMVLHNLELCSVIIHSVVIIYIIHPGYKFKQNIIWIVIYHSRAHKSTRTDSRIPLAFHGASGSLQCSEVHVKCEALCNISSSP
jgi:hypothetical protein